MAMLTDCGPSGVHQHRSADIGDDLQVNCRYGVGGLATWPSGSGNGLQSRPRGFDSRRRLRKRAGHGLRDGAVIT